MTADVDVQLALILAGIAFFAATINGAVGYGFSSVTVPSGLLVTTSRVLNPALVVVELFLNAASVWLNRAGLKGQRATVGPVLLGLAPGVAVGAVLVGLVAALPLKTATYALLLPLCLMQLLHRRTAQPPPSPSGETSTGATLVGAVFGVGLGALYATTTLSGPPLVLYFTRRGLHHDAFRGALAVVRLAESAFALIAYAALGLLLPSTWPLALAIAPAVLLGLPLGRRLARHLAPATFRRLVLSLDVVLLSVGLVACLRELLLLAGPAGTRLSTLFSSLVTGTVGALVVAGALVVVTVGIVALLTSAPGHRRRANAEVP